jgi:hypothetical protein
LAFGGVGEAVSSLTRFETARGSSIEKHEAQFVPVDWVL